MTQFNTDLTDAPRGRTVQVTRKVKTSEGVVDRLVDETRYDNILAVHKSGLVVQSYWIAPRHTGSGKLLEGNRWSGFNLGEDPIAWAPWPTYEPNLREGASEQPEAHGSSPCIGSREDHRPATYGQLVTAGETATNPTRYQPMGVDTAGIEFMSACDTCGGV